MKILEGVREYIRLNPLVAASLSALLGSYAERNGWLVAILKAVLLP